MGGGDGGAFSQLQSQSNRTHVVAGTLDWFWKFVGEQRHATFSICISTSHYNHSLDERVLFYWPRPVNIRWRPRSYLGSSTCPRGFDLGILRPSDVIRYGQAVRDDHGEHSSQGSLLLILTPPFRCAAHACLALSEIDSSRATRSRLS